MSKTATRMGFIERLMGGTPANPTAGRSTLAEDAVTMRESLDGLRREAGSQLDLRGVVADLLEGELPAPTADVRALRDGGTDPREFYAREVAPSWDGRNEAQRAARLDGFLEMCAMLDEAGDLGSVPPEMAATVRTKTLLIAWAFDEEYSYLPRLARGEEVRA